MNNLAVDLHRSIADVGFAAFASIALATYLSWSGTVRSPLGIVLSMFFGFFISLALFSWAHNVSIAESHKVMQICAIIIGFSIVGMISFKIVERAHPGVLFAIFATMAVCVLLGVLALWASFANLLLLTFVAALAASVAICAILAWAIVRKTEAEAPRQVGRSDEAYLPPQQSRIPTSSRVINLPARRDNG